MIVSRSGMACICPEIDGAEPGDSMVLYCHRGMDENMAAKTSKAKVAAIQRYNKRSTTQVILRLNHKTDGDIIRRLDEVESKGGYLKDLIRRDIKDIEERGNE